jgi:hypothetical protein
LALTLEERREIAAWFDAHSDELPERVRSFLALHQRYLAAEHNLGKQLELAWRELRRALHLTPSSERSRGSSGSPLSAVPASMKKSARQELEDEIAHSDRLASWHGELTKRHTTRLDKLKEKLAQMPTEPTNDETTHQPEETLRLEDIELSEEDRAELEANRGRLSKALLQGSGPDPALESVNETLMPEGTVLTTTEVVSLPAEIPADLADAEVVKTFSEPRVRYDFSVSVRRIELDIEKKVVVDPQGKRYVIAPSTSDYGPPGYSVTWRALATLAVLVGQFALPFNRLATLISTPDKQFKASTLSRMLHYVAERLLPVYLELAAQLADAEILAGDDTSCRVLEVSTYLSKSAAETDEPPWAPYRTPEAAQQSLRLCEQAQQARRKRRENGDRTARRTPAETPSLGVTIGSTFRFESLRCNGDGPKEALHTTVLSGRSGPDDPRSLIVFYRSHLGSCGNLLEDILDNRDPKLRTVILQGDLSTTNLVKAPRLLERFDFRRVGCGSHARRPFAIYKDEDPEMCEFMLHLFLGLAIHEERLDTFGRNRDNVLAVRGTESRELWNDIRELSQMFATKWPKTSKLGNGARYIINHFDELTAYLDDPRIEMTNNLRERMLRTEKLIEKSSMFRCSLEGRFVLDVIRTVLQTAVAANVPVLDYLVSLLRSSEKTISKHPSRFTPRAWAAANHNALDPSTASG